MSVPIADHERVEALVNDFLPDGYYLGYELIHTDVDDEALVRADHEIKRRWRERLGREHRRGMPGAADDLAALPVDATLRPDVHVLFEILHVPTRTRAIRTVAMDTLIALANEYQGANATRKTQIRTAIRNQLQNFYGLCEARVNGG